MAKTSSSAKEAPSSTNAPKTPGLGQGPSACTNPKPQRCANHSPNPPGPTRTLIRRRSAPRISSLQAHPGPAQEQSGDQACNPSGGSRQINTTQESPKPHSGQNNSPCTEPPKKPTPRQSPDPPSPYAPLTPLGDGAIKGTQRD